MGRNLRLIGLAVLAWVVGACSSASVKPPGFGEGTAWTMPLVGALGGGELMVPVTINGDGPYLFVIRTDQPSALDPRLAAKMGLSVTSDKSDGDSRAGVAGNEAAEHDWGMRTQTEPLRRPVQYADIASLEAGTLTLTGIRIAVRPTMATYHGRKAQGTLGSEVFADGVIWTIDRDRQLLALALPSAPSAQLDGEPVPLRIAGPAWYVDAVLNDEHRVELQITSAQTSSLTPAQAQQAALRALDQRAWLADSVQVGDSSAYEQLFVAQSTQLASMASGDDGSDPEAADPVRANGADGGAADGGAADADAEDRGTGVLAAADKASGAGTLGEDFFRGFRVTMSRSQQAMWLNERADDPLAFTAERLSRWGQLFDDCERAACATLTIVDGATATAMIAADAIGPGAAASDPSLAATGDQSGDHINSDATSNETMADRNKTQPKPRRERSAAQRKPGSSTNAAPVEQALPDTAGKPLRTARARRNHFDRTVFDDDATVLMVERDARMQGTAHDLLLMGFDEVDVPLSAPYLLVAMPKNAIRAAFDLNDIDNAYLRATSFQVIDATPLLPPCKLRRGCVWLHR